MDNLLNELSGYFTYNKETGKLHHNKNSARGRVGQVAGSLTNKHWYVRFKGEAITVSRVVWCFETGEFPKHPIRFIDGDPNNTRFDNLMETCSHKEANYSSRASGKTKLLPSLDRLNYLFYYDAEAGSLVNKVDRGVSKAGEAPAYVSLTNRAKNMAVDGVIYLEHRLIWYMLTGRNPKIIDHIDRDPTNNRAENLREASSSQNGANSASKAKRFLPGVKAIKGREGHKRPYMAYIGYEGKQIHLGYFETEEEAHETHKQAHLARYGEFSKFYQHDDLTNQKTQA